MFHNEVSAKNRVQDFNQIKLKVNDTYKKSEKITTDFEISKDEKVKNKAYRDTKLSKVEGQLSLKERD